MRQHNIFGTIDLVDDIDEILPLDFIDFWDRYDKKVGKPKCISIWNKISKKDKAKIFDVLDDYVQSKPNKQYRMNPQTWLNNKSWNDEIINNNKDAFSDDLIRRLANTPGI